MFITSIRAWASENHINEARVREWTRRKENPLPTYQLEGNGRNCVLVVEEANAWLLESGALLRNN